MTEPGTGDAPFNAEVACYLADCASHGLRNSHHPTVGGALKVIFHRGPEQEQQVRPAFRAAAARGRHLVVAGQP